MDICLCVFFFFFLGGGGGGGRRGGVFKQIVVKLYVAQFSIRGGPIQPCEDRNSSRAPLQGLGLIGLIGFTGYRGVYGVYSLWVSCL